MSIEEIAARLRVFFEQTQISQAEFARQSGVSQPVLSRILQGKVRKLRRSSIEALEAALERGEVGPPGDCVSREALEWAVEHVHKVRDTDLLPVPGEYRAVRTCPDTVLQALSRIPLDQHAPGERWRFLVPKRAGGYRLASQLDPVDHLLLSAAVSEIAPTLERARFPSDVVYSHRVEIEEMAQGSVGFQLFRQVKWSDFKDASSAAAEHADHVLVVDIADFYNQIPHSSLLRSLEDLGVDADRAENLVSLVTRVMGRARGLPVGPPFAALLAETVAHDLDAFFERSGVPHLRWVDDVHVFCASRSQARDLEWRVADHLLHRHGLTLNERKSGVKPAMQFRDFLVDQDDYTGLHDESEEPPPTPDSSDPRMHAIATERVTLARRDSIALMDAALAQEDVLLRKARKALAIAPPPCLDELLDVNTLSRLVPILRTVAQYAMRDASPKREPLARALLELAMQSEWRTLPYVRYWVCEVLIQGYGRLLETELADLVASTQEDLGLRPSAYLARRCRDRDWLRELDERWPHLPPWERRAVLDAASILTSSERAEWAARAEQSGDALSYAITQAWLR